LDPRAAALRLLPLLVDPLVFERPPLVRVPALFPPRDCPPDCCLAIAASSTCFDSSRVERRNPDAGRWSACASSSSRFIVARSAAAVARPDRSMARHTARLGHSERSRAAAESRNRCRPDRGLSSANRMPVVNEARIPTEASRLKRRNLPRSVCSVPIRDQLQRAFRITELGSLSGRQRFRPPPAARRSPKSRDTTPTGERPAARRQQPDDNQTSASLPHAPRRG
jgi:hypothetical protein